LKRRKEIRKQCIDDDNNYDNLGNEIEDSNDDIDHLVDYNPFDDYHYFWEILGPKIACPILKIVAPSSIATE
jgi:hypothetical protein